MAATYGDIKAICYLHREGDERNKIVLTEERLFVIHRKRTFEFNRENIRSVSWNIRKMMLPLIVGGVVASFSLVAILKDFFNPYLVTLTLSAGLLAFYLGWTGQPAFTVATKIKEYDFSVPQVSDNLKAFIRFFNLFKKGQISLFLIFPIGHWRKRQDDPTIALPVAARAYERREIKKMRKSLRNSIVVEIDPWRAGAEIKYQRDDESGKLCPFVFGEVDRNGIIQTETIADG